MRIVSIVEATTVNAVAKITLEFFRTARELPPGGPNATNVEGSLITFERVSQQPSPSEFVLATRAAELEIDLIPERKRFDLHVISVLQRVVEERRPDIVITNSIKSHFVMWRSGLWEKYPWVAYHHGYTTTDAKMRLYNRFDRWSLRNADLVITVCEAFARELSRAGRIPPGKIRVQHNSIRPSGSPNPAEVQAVRERFGIGEHERVILTVGRLSREKGQVHLLAALEHLRAADDLKLVIVGDGPERTSLEAAARSSRYAKRIVFTGQMTDVHPFYALADVFVLPSHSEGSPNVLLEAMAMRVPVVATAVGGVPEIVEHEQSALLISPGDPAAMAAAIDRLLDDSRLARLLTENGARLVVKNHAPEKYFRSLVECYREVIERRGS